MGMEIDTTEINLMFEGAKEIGVKALEYAAIDLWAISVEEANIKDGTLRGSIQGYPVSDDQWIVGTNLEHAPYVHEGTSPHEIVGNLYLYWPGAEHPVRRVQHPGYEGNPFFETAQETVEGRMEDYLAMATEGLE